MKPVHFAWLYIGAVILFGIIYGNFSKYFGLPDSWTDSFYLSVVTITTLGFGDITPAKDCGKIVVSIQAVIGVLTLGMFLNSLSHEASKDLLEAEENKELKRKEDLLKSLELHSCLLIDVFKSANPFAWDKHAKYSEPMSELEGFCRETYSNILNPKCKINAVQIKMLLETSDQNYDTLLSLTPVAAEISSAHLVAWSSLLSNVRNLKQQYNDANDKADSEGKIPWPNCDDIGMQVQELINTSLFISNKELMGDRESQ